MVTFAELRQARPATDRRAVQAWATLVEIIDEQQATDRLERHVGERRNGAARASAAEARPPSCAPSATTVSG